VTYSLSLSRFTFGEVQFDESEEFLAFQYRFLCVVMLSGALSTLVFVAGGLTGSNPMDPTHLKMMTVFSAVTLLLWWELRGHKARFRLVAMGYLTLCMAEYTSALVNVPSDELRVLWFFVNVPGVYLLLGQRWGLVMAVLTGAGLIVGNAHLSRPYSPNAMATALVALFYLALFFHLYTARSISYFKRMREYNERLLTLASVDPLTGIANARAYYSFCNRWLMSARRSGAPCSVLFVDLDHFKRINDSLGHAAGDTVLKAVADTLGSSIRRSDMVGRIGGEEFSIFLPDTDIRSAAVLGEKLRAAVESLTLAIDGKPLKVTASIGVATSAGHEASMAIIQQRADQAMYQAKSQGRNRVSFVGLVSG
jgi:diguanylate cyclase (GGDEF)-like protein